MWFASPASRRRICGAGIGSANAWLRERTAPSNRISGLPFAQDVKKQIGALQTDLVTGDGVAVAIAPIAAIVTREIPLAALPESTTAGRKPVKLTFYPMISMT